MNEFRGNAENVVQIRDIYGSVHVDSSPQRPVTRNLVTLIPPVDRLTAHLRGRDSILSTLLNTALNCDGSTTAITGPGGTGKTSVALALAQLLHQHPADMHVWWLDATTEHGLYNAFREIAFEANAPADQVNAAWAGHRSPVGVLKQALGATSRRWLIIIDNGDDARLLQPWMPALRHQLGRVVITTRDSRTQSWPTGTTLLPLEPLPTEHAADVLLSLAPGAGTRDAATELARALGGLPLVLHLAGRCIGASAKFAPVRGASLPSTFDRYRRIFGSEFLQIDELHALTGDLARRERLTETWELSLDLLHEFGVPHARPLLRLLASFAQAPLPYGLLDANVLAAAPVLAGMTENDLLRTLSALEAFGLISEAVFRDGRMCGATTRCLLLHAVIRDASRHQSEPDHATRERVALCIALLNRAASWLNLNRPYDLSLLHASWPHHAAMGDLVAQDPTLPGGWELLATQLARTVGWDHVAPMNGVAETLFSEALATRQHRLGQHHPDVFAARVDLAAARWVHQNRKSPEAATQLCDEFAAVVEACNMQLGPNHPITRSAQLDLTTFRNEGLRRVAEAEELAAFWESVGF